MYTEKILRALERRFQRFGIPNMALWLLAPKVVFVLMYYSKGGDRLAELALGSQSKLVPALLIEKGEWWRLLTFLAPAPVSLLWFLIYAYLLYLFCSGLEASWGRFRLTLYVFITWLATVLFSLLAYVLDPAYEGKFFDAEWTIFLAFAALYPNFTLNLFFVLPVKVRYLAYIAWALVLFDFLNAPWTHKEDYAHRLVLLGIYSNFFLFFGEQYWRHWRDRLSARKRRRQWEQAMKD